MGGGLTSTECAGWPANIQSCLSWSSRSANNSPACPSVAMHFSVSCATGAAASGGSEYVATPCGLHVGSHGQHTYADVSISGGMSR